MPVPASAVGAQIAEDPPLRQSLPDGGELYIDHALPLLCVHRPVPEHDDAWAPGLVTAQAAYLHGPDAAVCARIADVVNALGAACDGVLVIEVWSRPLVGETQQTETYSVAPAFRIEAPEDPALEPTVTALALALQRVTLQEQSPQVHITCEPRPAPPGLAPLMPYAEDGPPCWVLGVEVDAVYCHPVTGVCYPFLYQELRRQFSDALKKGAYTFARRHTRLALPNYLALGPRGLPESVQRVDKALAAVEGDFQFLLQMTPTNVQQEWEAFERSGFANEPQFQYRPLDVDPELLKRRLFEVPVEKIDDPTLADLYREKLEELDRKVTMLRDRQSRKFYHGSLALYGEPRPHLRRVAAEILERVPLHDYDFDDTRSFDCHEFADAARPDLLAYHRAWEGFPQTVQIRDDMPGGLMVSQGHLLIGKTTRVPTRRVDALVQHEVGTHMVTYYNGQAQPLAILMRGTAGYEALQEGIAVFSEYLVGGLDVPRLRVLAARVLAAQCVVESASFAETFRLLCDDHGFRPRLAFTIAMRVFRGGGLIKDVIYLRGLIELLDWVQAGGDVEHLYIGKVALHHVPVLDELRYRGVLREPPLRPRFLDRPDTAARLERARSGLTFVDLVEKTVE